ncbi:MAG: dihydroorotate dehydrogenase [Acidobacteriaceae bacterium]|nr:dihydroorotate dehydrogenase [Acidobacteriaceae bacterium]
MTERLATTLCGIPLRNPVLAASGTFGYGLEFAKLVPLERLGAIVTKGLSREPIAGNPAPRLWHTEGGMINSVGLQNVGVGAFIRDKLPKLREYDVPVIANVFGYRIEDYLEVLRALENTEGLAAYELNISCPNTKEGGIFFSSDPAATFSLVNRARFTVSRRPLIVKLSPNVAAIQPFAKAAEQAGADAISLINTFVSLALNHQTRTSRIGAGFGGLSGPAIKPIALRLVYEAVQTVDIPVIGLGGICNGKDAADFFLAGARAVQVGTATFVDPRAPLLVAQQLDRVVANLGADHVDSLIGTARLHSNRTLIAK